MGLDPENVVIVETDALEILKSFTVFLWRLRH